MANVKRNLPTTGSTTRGRPSDLFRLQRSIDRVFDRFLEPLEFHEGGELGEAYEFMPPVDIEESEKHYLLSFDLPGVKKEDVQIRVEGDELIVSGERRREERKQEGKTYSTERYYGNFVRSFTLPTDVKPEDVQANYHDGVLEIAIPKMEAKPGASRTIQIGEEKGGLLSRILGTKKEKAA